MKGRGLLITFEGTEGSGKTTQMRLLMERLRGAGYELAENQEPGATRVGREIRRLLLDPTYQEMEPMTELLLMFASRAQAAAEIIVPALGRGEIVVSDRFTDSTLAYQGEARGLGFERVLEAHRLALGRLMPDLTLCIALDVETGLKRASENRMERQPLAFHERVAAGYRKIAAAEPGRFRMVDGRGAPAQVAELVWAEASRVLAENRA